MKKIIALCGLLVLGGVQNNKALPTASGEEEKHAEHMQNARVGFVQIRDSGMNDSGMYYEFPGSSPFAVKEDYFSVVEESKYPNPPLNSVIPPQK